MKRLSFGLIIVLLMALYSCIPQGGLRFTDIFKSSAGDERDEESEKKRNEKTGNETEKGRDSMEAINEPYFFASEDMWNAILYIIQAHSIPYEQREEEATIETSPVVPEQVKGWRQKMSSGDCETVFRVQVKRISENETGLDVQVIFPRSQLNKGKNCEGRASFLRERFLDEIHEALYAGQTNTSKEGHQGAEPGKSMAIAVRKANIRSSPSTKSKVITRLDHGSRVIVLVQEGEWVQVELESGQEGWIHGSLLEEAALEAEGGEEQPEPVSTQQEDAQETAERNTSTPKVGDWEKAGSPPKKDLTQPESLPRLSREREPQAEKVPELKKSRETEETPDQLPDQALGPPSAPREQEPESTELPPPGPPHKTEVTEKKPMDAGPPPDESGPALFIRQGAAADVFKGPSVFSPKLGRIEAGTRIPSFERKGNFFKISHGGVEGYVYKDFCKIQE
jgi:SH3-like domain-containing protein